MQSKESAMRIVKTSILAIGLMGLFAACGGGSKSENTTPEAAPAEEGAPAEGEAAPAEGENPCGAANPCAPAEPAAPEGGEGGGW
jgi:hypothetical protein